MAATWLVSSDPTPTPRTANRAKTRIIPGATAPIWWTMSENDPPWARQGDAAADHGAGQHDDGQARRRATAAIRILPSDEPGPVRCDQERGGDRLVPELDGDDQHAEQQGEEVALDAPSPPGCGAAGRCGGAGVGGPKPPRVPRPAVAVVEEVDQDEQAGDDQGDAGQHPRDRSVVRSLSHSERRTAIMPVLRAWGTGAGWPPRRAPIGWAASNPWVSWRKTSSRLPRSWTSS